MLFNGMHPSVHRRVKHKCGFKQDGSSHSDGLPTSTNDLMTNQTKLSARTLRFHPYLACPFYFKPKHRKSNKYDVSCCTVSSVAKPAALRSMPPNFSTHSNESPLIESDDSYSYNSTSVTMPDEHSNTSPAVEITSNDMDSSEATIYACCSPIREIIEIDSSSAEDSDDTVPLVCSDLDDTLPMCLENESPQSVVHSSINPCVPSTSATSENGAISNSDKPFDERSKASLIYSSSMSKDSLKMKLKLVRSASTHLDQENVIPFNEYFYGEVISGFHNLLKIPFYDTVLVKCPICYNVLTNVTVIHHYLKHFNFNIMKNHPKPHFVCPQCLKPFRSLYHLQSHINRHCIRRDNSARECLICETEFISDLELALHFRNVQHAPQDTPYSCEICFNYKTSFFSNLWQHFTSVHEGEYCVICPYCLKYFEILRLDKSRQWDLPPAFQNHIERHVKGPNYACTKCRLMFLNAKGVSIHDFLYHTGKSLCAIDEDEILKSLSSVNHSTKLKFYVPRGLNKCAECKQPFTNSSRHFLKEFSCSVCHYQTMCSVNATLHKRKCTFGSRIARGCLRSNFHERLQKMVCPCNFVTHYGDDMAQHLASCSYSYANIITCEPKYQKSKAMKTKYLSFVSLLPA